MAVTAARTSPDLEEYSDAVYVFEPGNDPRPSFGEYRADVWRRRNFIVALANADIQGQNSSQILGRVWAVLDPLIQAAIYWMLITLIRGSGNQGASAAETAALIIGMVFLFTQVKVAFGEASRELMKRKGLILNSTFPMAIFPLSCMYRGLIEFIPCIPVYIGFAILAGMPFGPGIALLPFLLVLELLMGFGIALLTTTAIVFVRDIGNLMNYVMRILFFMTPIIYPVEKLQETGPFIQAIIWINPLFPLFAAYQMCLTGRLPSMTMIVATIAWTAFYLVVGYRVFTKNERAFAIRL